MYFGLLKHLFQDFEGDTVELQNVILTKNVITRTKQLGLNLSVLGLAKVLWTFSRPFQDKLYFLRDPRFLVYEKIL